MGCLSGDTAGYPVSINGGNSYILTGNLEINSSANGIEIWAGYVEMLLDTLRANAAAANGLIGELVGRIPPEAACGCGRALAAALITSPAVIPPATRERLSLLVDRYLT